MELTCMIIDDEPLAIEVIEAHAAAYGDLRIAGTYRNAVAAFRALADRPVDVVFLDIEMPQLTGLDLVRALSSPPQVVLTTAHRHYAVEGFDLDATDYLVKPIRFERFVEAMGKVKRRAGASGAPDASSNPSPVTDEPEPSIVVRVDRRNVRIPAADIVWMESRRDDVEIHTDSDVIKAPGNLGDLVRELEPHGMIRIHRSFAAMQGRIEAWTASEVVIDGRPLPIGRTYRREVRGLLER